MDQSIDDDVLTIKEAAALLKVSVMTVRRRIKEGQLPTHRVGPRLIRVLRHDVESLLTSSVAQESSPTVAADVHSPLTTREMTRQFDAVREAKKLRRRMLHARRSELLPSSADVITTRRQQILESR